MYESEIRRVHTYLGDFLRIMSSIGYTCRVLDHVRSYKIGIEKDEVTILIGIPVILTPPEEEPR